MTADERVPPRLTPRRVRGLVFDLDGTLVDSYEAIAESLNHARAAFDLAPLPAGEIRARVGRGLEALVEDLVGADRVEQAVRLFRERYSRVYAANTRILPRVRPTLRTLAARGYRMSVASNKPARFGEAIVRGLGLGPYLVGVQGPDRVGTTKPDPRMIRHCVASMRVDAGSALYVGDMVLDVESAARAGVPVVLVAGGSSSTAELRATRQTLLDSFADLLLLLP